jgi:hypothetical protein
MAWKTMMGESSDPADAAKMMREVMGPQAVDQFIRQAISTCWMMLPEEEKTIEALEREVRRLVDRALKDLKEDMAAFGISGTRPKAPSTPRKKKR